MGGHHVGGKRYPQRTTWPADALKHTHTHYNTKGEYRHTYKYSQVLEIVVMHVYCGSMYTG